MKNLISLPAKRLRSTVSTLSLVTVSLIAPATQALETGPGDFEVIPGGINVAMIYYQHAERDSLYTQGNKVPGNYKLTTDIGIFRYIRPVQLSPSVTLDLNVIQPFGHIDSKGSLSALGNASGMGDLTLGPVLKFLLDPVTRDVFSIAPFIVIPTGKYDRDDSLNLGDNRWSGILQLAYVKHFFTRWALDTVGDVTLYGPNDEAAVTGGKLKQDPRYEVQTHLRYILSPSTTFSAGLGHYEGGETELNNVSRDDKLKTTYGRMSVTHFVDKTSQLQLMLGKDLNVENGFKENMRINLRIAKIF